MSNNHDALWWKGGVIYQIYPRSFQDSNGDGVGDIKGIISRLPYIADLGVDAIWISPFFKSPMKDFGYDVSDYRDIDPMFGTLLDFDELLRVAHELGLKIMVDLVISHTSDQHPWFIQSRQSRDNDKADWYVWADPKEDGTMPNNWLSIFGGSAWQWDTRREQYYLHNFLTSQPDLNFHNKDVQDAVLDVARFWLERGVDGFRLDTINFYFHDDQLRSNPPLPVEKRNASIAPKENPYNHQEHVYSKTRPENLIFLERLRALCDQYDARACLGEVGEAQYGLEVMGQYTEGDKRMHMCYAFEFLEKTPATAHWVEQTINKLQSIAPNSWPCWAFSNHDVPRHKSRWHLSETAYKPYIVLMMALRGSACIYQGEELGFDEAEVSYEALQDPYGIEFWPEFKGRDGCRTPMAWEHLKNDGGFGSGAAWLPMSSDQLAIAADTQISDDTSCYAHYKKAIALRKSSKTLQYGAQSLTKADNDLLTICRTFEGEEILCLFNLGDQAISHSLPPGAWHTLTDDMDGAARMNDGIVHLAPWQYCLLQKGN